MSIDKSLRVKGKLARQRNVLTRAERIERLSEDGRWDESESVYGLPKVRGMVIRKKAKTEKKKAEEAEAAPAGAEETTAEGAKRERK